MYIVGIEYDDESPDSYAGVVLSRSQKEVSKIMTGCPTNDFLATTLLYQKLSDKNGDKWLSCSSSVDHFVMDGGILKEDNFSELEISNALEIAKLAYKNLNGENKNV
jgi:hypothetical protein